MFAVGAARLWLGTTPPLARPSSAAATPPAGAKSNKPIEFSKTPAANATIYDAIAVPQRKSHTATRVVLLFGAVLCTAIVYNVLTGTREPNAWTAPPAHVLANNGDAENPAPPKGA
eukprot:m.235194 g.235194  ORF g.235194 m.235194 type:complete len:116 (+) comp12782_c0_seq1:16-363(+)